MNIDLIESKYTELQQAFKEGKIAADEFQAEVDALRTQDDYGRYWMIGAETGFWYYYDGVEWVQADPTKADTLPFVDDDGIYWMLGKESNAWYFYDGKNWVRPEPEQAEQTLSQTPAIDAVQDQTAYFQDDEGRYWAQGAKSGKWYFYDETGWHSEDELPQKEPYQPGAMPYQPQHAQSAPQPSPAQPGGAFRPVQPAPQYLQSQDMQAATPDYAQPTSQPYQQPQYQPQQPSIDPNAYTQPVAPQPQPSASQPPPPEPGVWYYFDGEQWLRYQDDPNAQTASGATAAAAVAAGAYAAAQVSHQMNDDALDDQYLEDESYSDEDDLTLEEENLIEIEDLDDYVEVVEVDKEDIIDAEDDTIEAEFQVEILTPAQEAATTTKPVTPTTEQTTTSSAGAAPKVEPEPEQQAETHTPSRPAPQATAQPAATQPQKTVTAPKAKPAPSLKIIPAWFWTSLGGVGTLIIVAALIIAALYLLNNREKGRALIAAEQTPTLSAAAPEHTPTSAPTPTPTATVPPTATPVPVSNYSSNYFGFELDYPAGWLLNEDDDLVIFAPSSRALDRDSINGGSLWISLAEDADLTQLLADSLEKFSPISETLTEGVMDIGEQSWASAQIRFDSESLGEEAIALIASIVVNNNGYTLVAVAPASEWDNFKPLFQHTINSFRFSEQQAIVAATPQTENTPESAEPAATPTTSKKAIATPITLPATSATSVSTPSSTEPLTYEVQPGDTLGAIAKKFDVSIADLVKANGLADQNALIGIGQELIIPQGGVTVAAITATSAPGAKDTPEADAIETTQADTTDPTDTPVATKAPAATPTSAATATPTPETEVALSGRIAYPAYSTDINSFNVWSANVDGSDPLIIAGNASQPKYNTDGSLLAYRSWTPNNRGIYFVDFPGGRQGLLTSFIEDSLPSWSSDGTVVFTSRREGDRVPRIFRVRQEGEGGYSMGFISEYADVMSDGRLVARGCTVSGDCGLWKLLPDGSGEAKLSSDTSDTAPAANPLGGRIALMSFDRDSAGNWEIWTINPDGSDPIRLTEDSANDGLPAWSPDGKSIAFVSDRGGVWAIWAMNSDGSNQRKLFNMQGSPNGQVLHDVPNSRGWLEERITWIP